MWLIAKSAGMGKRTVEGYLRPALCFCTAGIIREVSEDEKTNQLELLNRPVVWMVVSRV